MASKILFRSHGCRPKNGSAEPAGIRYDIQPALIGTAVYKWTKHLSALAQLRYSDNLSNVDSSKFNKFVVNIGLNYYYF